MGRMPRSPVRPFETRTPSVPDASPVLLPCDCFLFLVACGTLFLPRAPTCPPETLTAPTVGVSLFALSPPPRHNRSLPRRLALGRAHAAMAGLRVEVAVAPGGLHSDSSFGNRL